jgi:hypothetical protein
VLPIAEVVEPPAPRPPAPVATTSKPTTTSDDDIFAKIAEADDPVAAAANARKPKPAEGEPGNPLSLGDDDEPPARARPVSRKPTSKGEKSEKSDKPAKSGKKKRVAEWEEDETRTKGGINPVWFLGGLGVLAVGVLAVGMFFLTRHFDQLAEEEAATAQREAERKVREKSQQRDRETQQNPKPKPETVNPDPGEAPPLPPRPGTINPGAGPDAGPGPAPAPAVPPFKPPAPPPVNPPFNPPPVNPPPLNPNPGVPAQPVKPKVESDIVHPAVNPAKITPTKAADKTELKLPGAVDMTCFGGGGRYVLLRIPSTKKVAVLDVCEGKIAKYIPIPEDGAFIAASNEHLFVLAPTNNVIQRWNLTTLEKERTVANPLNGQVRGLLIGHATDGPLFVIGPNKLLHPKTFKEVDLKVGGNRGLGMAGHPQYPPTVRVSADGRVFAWYTRGLSPSGLSSMVLGGNDGKCYYGHTTVGAILPGPDGTLFTAGGLFTPELKPIGEKRGYQYWYHAPIPAAHGRMYITVAPEDDTTLPGRRGPQKVSLKMIGENKPLLDLSDFAGLDVPKNHNQTVARGLQLYDRVFLVPDAKALAILHGTHDKITIHKLDVESALDKAGIDFLFVTSRPGGAVCGKVYSYKPEVKSRKGGVKVKLDAGPDGMKVAADGTVTWSVPENFADTEVSVILTISDSSGQEVFHTFTLPVASRP